MERCHVAHGETQDGKKKKLIKQGNRNKQPEKQKQEVSLSCDAPSVSINPASNLGFFFIRAPQIASHRLKKPLFQTTRRRITRDREVFCC